MDKSVIQLENALDLVNSHQTDSYGLLRALLPYKDRFRPYSGMFRRGTVLWSVASSLDSLRGHLETMNIILPLRASDNPIYHILRDESVATASVVFKAWISFSCMRFDDLLRELESIPIKSEHLVSFVELLKLNEVRHIRNAISHGSFEAEFGIFKWTDRSINGELSYELLQRLSLAIFTFWLSLDA